MGGQPNVAQGKVHRLTKASQPEPPPKVTHKRKNACTDVLVLLVFFGAVSRARAEPAAFLPRRPRGGSFGGW
eukprot:4973207-Prymnesium_polylepis.1